MDRKESLQLLPGTKKRLGIKVPGENRFLYVGSAILGATLVTIFTFSRYQASLETQIKQMNDQLITLEQARDKEGEQNLRLVKDRVELTGKLLNEHVYWTEALSTIVNLLQSNTRFKSFSADVNAGTIGISIQVSSYTVLARQVASFLTEEGISDISLGRISPASSGVLETTLDIKFDKAKLFYKNK